MADTYIDRKMLKWLPFQSLPEQADEISELLNGRKKETMPVLSEDQLSTLQYRFEEAYHLKTLITVIYFKNGTRHKLSGVIVGADPISRFLILNTGTVLLDYVIDIE
ncbi:MAG: YolD-like family protein [Candidatus Izemoplasmataceae bacterium]